MATNQDALNALQAMSPVRRAAQLAADTITNAANKATFGGVGAVGDLARGVPLGTTGDQISAQLTAASPFAQAASSGIGYVAPIGRIVRGGKMAFGLARNALFDGAGERALALGAKTALKPGVKTALKAAAVPAGIAATAGYLTSDPGTPAAAKTVPAKPAPNNAVDAALAAGAASKSPDAASAVQNYIANVFNGKAGVTAREAEAAASTAPLLAAATKQPDTLRNVVLGNTADLSRQIYQTRIDDLHQQLAEGKITQKQAQDAVEQEAMAHFQRTAGLVGFDPSKLVQAQLLQGGGE